MQLSVGMQLILVDRGQAPDHGQAKAVRCDAHDPAVTHISQSHKENGQSYSISGVHVEAALRVYLKTQDQVAFFDDPGNAQQPERDVARKAHHVLQAVSVNGNRAQNLCVGLQSGGQTTARA